jgi:hypothetical protein
MLVEEVRLREEDIVEEAEPAEPMLLVSWLLSSPGRRVGGEGELERWRRIVEVTVRGGLEPWPVQF